MATVRVCRTTPSAGPLIVADDGSTDNTGHAAHTAGTTIVRHFVECGRASATETGVRVTAMCDRLGGLPHHILLPSPGLGNSAIETITLAETVFVCRADMVTIIPTTNRECSDYGPGIARRFIRRKIDWNCHYPLNYQRHPTHEVIGTAMPSGGRYVLKASATINVLRMGLSIMEAPCNFAYSDADRSLGSLNRLACMFDAMYAMTSQLFHSGARSRRHADHE